MKLQRMRPGRFRNIVLLVLAVVTLSCHRDRSVISAQELTQIDSVDNTTYYVVDDEFLATGLELIDSYWGEVAKTGRHLLRGHLDNYLPIALKSLEYEPADLMMRSFADSFFGARDRKTGLIPYSYESWLDQAKTMQTKGKQPVALISQGVKLCQWFSEDLSLQNDCLALASDTIEHFDFEPGSDQGLWGWVDVKTGSEPRISLTLIQDYGAIANALSYLSESTGNPELMSWADKKLDFVWQNRLNANLPLLNEQFLPTQALLRPEELSSDTDTLYYVRHLFELYELTGEEKYRDWAIAVTDLWYEESWQPEYGHFSRKLNPDGTAAVNTLYGDGKYNTLYVLIHAYEVTRDPKYINRVKEAWDNLLQMGDRGLVAEYLKQGQMVEKSGLDKQQTIFLDILVEAYEVSGDREILQAAEDLGRRIIAEGESVMRIEGGQAGEAFLRLALTRGEIQRLEIPLGEVGRSLIVTKDGEKVFETIVPAEVAVVYFPEGNYEISNESEIH